MGQLFDELKRRNVIRVAVAYVVSAWLVLQVADVAIDNIGAPEWVFFVFLLAGGLFFLPVLFFSWAYEITPEGVKKESEVDRGYSITHQTGRKLDLITIGMLVAVVTFVMIERVWLSQPGEVSTEESSAATVEVTATTASEKSIAVLAFDDLSPEGDQAFFVEGLSEEILNVLAQTPGLKVAGRTSSFAFKDKDTDLREIGELLNVAHILEGSVRKDGDKIRVTAQLIQASDGFHLFSKSYDRDLDDVFAVQDDLAGLIGEALKTELSDTGSMPTVTATSVAAYDLYLQARQRIHSRIPELMTEAGDLLDHALEIDPYYAPALAQRALVWSLMSDAPGAYGDIPDAIAVKEGLALVTRALDIDSNLAEGIAIYGMIVGDLPGRRDEGMAYLRQAVKLNPNADDGKIWLARLSGDLSESISIYEQIISRDPFNKVAFRNLIGDYTARGELDLSDALIDRVKRISGLDDNVQGAIGGVALMRGDLSEAVRNMERAFVANPNNWVAKVNLGLARVQIGDLRRAAEDGTRAIAILAHSQLGDAETVDRMISETDFLTGNRQLLLEFSVGYLVAHGRSAEVIDIVDGAYGDISQMLEDRSGYAAHLGALACAYLDEGDEQAFEVLVEALKTSLDEQRARGFDNQYFWIDNARYAVLARDTDAAIGYLQTALDMGYASVVTPGPSFKLIADDPRFQSFETTALARANQERAELGMAPYEPPLGL